MSLKPHTHLKISQLVNKVFLTGFQQACEQVVTLLLFHQAATSLLPSTWYVASGNSLRAGDARLVRTTCNKSDEVVSVVTRSVNNCFQICQITAQLPDSVHVVGISILILYQSSIVFVSGAELLLYQGRRRRSRHSIDLS